MTSTSPPPPMAPGLADPPRILRCELPVDGQAHQLPVLPGQVVHVDCRAPGADVVELWAVQDGPVRTGTYLVTATEQSAPSGARYVGTALSPALTGVHLLPGGGVTGPRERGTPVWHGWALTS